MNPQPYKKILEQKLASLTAELQTIGYYEEKNDNWEALPEDNNNQPDADPNINADRVEDWNERRSTLDSLEREYRSYERALQKIERGNYGICEIAGEPIEEARLQIKPDARTCVAHMDEEANLAL